MYIDIFPNIETKCTSGDQTCKTSAKPDFQSRCYPQSTTPEVIG